MSSYTWVLYKRSIIDGVLTTTGYDGRQENVNDPTTLAADMLRLLAAVRAGRVVKVYDTDDRLAAWAEKTDDGIEAHAVTCNVCGDPGQMVDEDYALCDERDESHLSVRESLGLAGAR